MKVYINYQDKRWRKYKIDFMQIANMAAIDVSPDAEVSITLTNDAEIQKINKQYRGKDAPTNVLSFELGDDILLGDIFISLDTVMREAKNENISVAEHTAHMVVHGMLHLQGYDHIKNSDARKMENLEINILKKLNIKNPYAPESCICSDLSCCPGGKFFAFLHRLKIRPDGFWQYILMALMGAICALGFAPFNLWWATLGAIFVAYRLMLRTHSRGIWGAFVRVLPFSAMYAIAMFWWVTNSIYVVPDLAAQFAIWTVPALVGIGIVGGFIFAIPFVVIMRMRTNPASRVFVFAAIWTLVLWLREWAFTGFPWNPIANIMMPFPMIVNSMSLWGALGLTFVCVGIIAALAELFGQWRNWRVWGVFAVFILLGIGGAIYGAYNMSRSNVSCDASPVIRIIQPARSAVQKASHSRADAIRNADTNIAYMTGLAVINNNADLVVFPETAYPYAVLNGDDMPMATQVGANMIIGATHVDDAGVYNSMIVANPNGMIKKIYSKSHLVPFGEYRPFGDIIPTPGQLSQGAGPEIISVDLSGKTFSFAPAICYEIIFSDSLVPAGANPDAIINITNDTWFGATPGTYQHLDMVRRYAIESGLPIVRANYSGISAFVNPDGTILSLIPIAQPGYADGVVCGAHSTPYRAIGRDGWMIIILAFSCVCVMFLNRCCEKNKAV